MLVVVSVQTHNYKGKNPIYPKRISSWQRELAMNKLYMLNRVKFFQLSLTHLRRLTCTLDRNPWAWPPWLLSFSPCPTSSPGCITSDDPVHTRPHLPPHTAPPSDLRTSSGSSSRRLRYLGPSSRGSNRSPGSAWWFSVPRTRQWSRIHRTCCKLGLSWS